MKTSAKAAFLFLTILAIIGGSLNARAQGRIYFDAQLTGNTDASGSGVFSLTTSNLLFVYSVTNFFGWSVADIRQPAPGQEVSNAAVIADLFLRTCDAPIGTNAGYCWFNGGLFLTSAQADDLTSGKWYVYSPDGPFFIQGQIVAAPEPPSAVLIVLGALLVLCTRKLNYKTRGA